LPAHEFAAVQAIVLAPASVVTPWPHDDAPEQATVQLAPVHVTGPLHAPVPHFTLQLEPPQLTALHELAAPQSMVHALAALQSMAPQPLAPHVTAQGIPGGQVTPPVQLPPVEQLKTHVPPLHVPPLPQAPVHALASGAGERASSCVAGVGSSPFAASPGSPSGAVPMATSSKLASRSSDVVPSSAVASLSMPASPATTPYGGS
jgi:hypothetical protein